MIKEGEIAAEINRQLVETIANQKMTEELLSLQLQRLKLMYEVVTALSVAKSIQSIYQIGLNGIALALNISRASIITVEKNTIKYQAVMGISEQHQASVENILLAPAHLNNMKLRTIREGAILPDDQRLANVLIQEKIGAIATFAIENENHELGSLVAYFDEPRQFTKEESQLVQTIINYIAIAIARQQAEEALARSQQFIKRIADTTPSIIYVYDLENHCNVYSNESIFNLLGYTPEELQDMGTSVFLRVVHPDDVEILNAHYDRIRDGCDIESEELFIAEYRLLDKQGNWKWFYSKETIFETDAQNRVKQVIGVASDITKLKETEQRLQSSIVEKEVLLREVHHRVKNNLGVIDGILAMQMRYIKDEQAIKAISDSQSRIHTMVLIHEQLYQSNHGVDKVDFSEYLNRLAGNLFHSSSSFDANQIELKLDTKSTIVHIDMAISMGLLVNELLTNAFKYAFPNQNKGLIDVILQPTETNLHLTIRDNGIGIPEGIKFNTPVSLGFRLVDILSKQLRANLEIESNAGTSFHFTFPR